MFPYFGKYAAIKPFYDATSQEHMQQQPGEVQECVARWTDFIQKLADVVMHDWSKWVGSPTALIAGRESFNYSFREVMLGLLPSPPAALASSSAPPTPPASGGRVASKPV